MSTSPDTSPDTGPTISDAHLELGDLIDRLTGAALVLSMLRDTQSPTSTEWHRLHGKTEGVTLALSYVRDRERTT